MLYIYRYVLNTDVDTPHKGRVSAVSFAPPSEDDSPVTMFVSVSAEDKKFKLWTLTENGW